MIFPFFFFLLLASLMVWDKHPCGTPKHVMPRDCIVSKLNEKHKGWVKVNIISLFKGRKLNHREIKWLVKGQTESKLQSMETEKWCSAP